MEDNKKQASSTESSSGSTSDSSSSSSSSSGSESSSSSDSDSSSSQASTKVSETKKSTPVQKNVKRNSDTAKQPQSNLKQDNKPLTKQKPVLPKPLKPTVKIEISSTDDEELHKPGNISKHSTKKKTITKPKPSTPSGNVNKTEPSRTQPKTQQPSNKPFGKSNEVSKNNQHKLSSNTKVSDKDDPNKKKSIFSPENSSEDSEGTSKVISTQKPVNKAPKRFPPKVPDQTVKKNKKPQNHQIESNSVSSEDRSSSDSSSSDTDSSEPSIKKVKKNDPKPKSCKQNQNSNTDSENDTNDCKKTLRKSTRSANTRKSKHVLGKNVYSDTDSDTESTKRSSSHSPVKKAPVSSKGKAKKKSDNAENKSRANDILIEERTCPLESCNSLGHISGKFAKHFTLEACPMYHNMSPSQCKEESIERKKREDNRKRILDIFKKSQKATILQEQKQNLQQIREARSKFEYILPDESKTSDTNREPILDGFVPDYDLKLFKDAQAIAAEKIEEDLKTQPHTKATKYIEMGKYEMEVWYQSPYPEDFTRLPKLYICEFCLRYMKSRTVLMRHIVKCVWRHPPGEEVYRKDKISVWEVDGKKYKQYCQNLCLLAKFFLDHKTLYYDVEPFLFYVMTIYDTEGCHTVGYFSKEKNSFLNYNVSCILTLPPYQRQGYGRLLIDFSYLLTRVEGKIGSPEKPLSDLGLISYRSYWKDVLLGYLCANSNPALSVKDISAEMAISSYDIVSTLQALGMMKYWKGKHIILKKQDVIDEYVERTKRRTTALKEVDRACLRWNPPQPASV
ncbi:histone acetyltransferase KAT7 [Coccinella septempunctata]|uniref:histone acetyltransferase KAT7 n=1 Tax=Coccinella septempunctata TaxID=41139 RepID=UPI001D096494|nr:histone acetyltransferase KAT7 [Coccinella septempunctata]